MKIRGKIQRRQDPILEFQKDYERNLPKIQRKKLLLLAKDPAYEDSSVNRMWKRKILLEKTNK